MRLYHYTCDHGILGITADGATKPNTHPLLPGTPAVTWLTDMDIPDRDALGLTSRYIACDRTRHRLAVDSENIASLMHWPTAARAWKLPLHIRGQLETGAALPMHWWITTAPIDVMHASITADADEARCRGLHKRSAIGAR